MRKMALSVCLLAGTACLAAADRTFVEMERGEIVRAVPALAQLDWAPGPAGPLVTEIANARAGFVDAQMVETRHHVSFTGPNLGTNRREQFLYFVELGPPIEETRADSRSGARITETGAYHLEELVDALKQPAARYRQLGRLGGQIVIAFAGPGHQGLVWINAKSRTVERMRLDAGARSTDLEFTTAALPARVTVRTLNGADDDYVVYRYSSLRVNGHAEGRVTEPEDSSGVLARLMLARSNPAEALPLLREALRIGPDAPALRFQLAAALWKLGDTAGALAEARTAVNGAPALGPAHNLLGILLVNSDPGAAAKEFRQAAELQPGDASVQYNLAQTLESLGEHAAALVACRAAARLDPANEKYRTRLAELEAAPAALRVEVRQVMVPVVVTDAEGHHIPGLTRSDFQIFEDDIEQRITSFSVESAAAPVSAPPAEAQPKAPTAPQSRPAVRRTYVICLDTAHSEFTNLTRVREALEKLFEAEQSGDAQYVLAAIGRTTEILVNTTSDPRAVLAAVRARDFEKVYQSGTRDARKTDMRDFRRDLDEARADCDRPNRYDTACSVRRTQLPLAADAIARFDETELRTFLRRFRDLIEQFAAGSGRRTVVLLSDGFDMVPGREALELLSGYFPDMRVEQLRSTTPMRDELESLVRLTANADIAIETIDTRGLHTQELLNAENAEPHDRTASVAMAASTHAARQASGTLDEIAAATGGTAFHNSNDLLFGLRRAFSDGREYYVLSYTPTNTAHDGKFRTISVRLKNEKLRVATKRGYWP